MLAVVASVTFVLTRGNGLPPDRIGGSPAPTRSAQEPTPRPTQDACGQPFDRPAPPRGVACGPGLDLPGTRSRVFTEPGRTVLWSYLTRPRRIGDNQDGTPRVAYTAYVRDLSADRYAATPYTYAAVSADGRRIVALEQAPPSRSAVLLDRDGGRRAVDGLTAPVSDPTWSPDGTKVLATAWTGGRRAGFVVIDAATGRARTVTLPDLPSERSPFRWSGRGTGVMVEYHGPRPPEASVWFLDLTGATIHDYPGIGGLGPGPAPATAPDGRTMATRSWAHGQRIVDVATGRPVRTLTVEGTVVGWYDSDHLILQGAIPEDAYFVTDLRGRITRLLLRRGGGEGDIQPIFGPPSR